MFPFNLLSNHKTLLATLYLRYFGLRKIPLLFFVKPSVVSWDDETTVFKIPLRRRTKNHLGSMYFAVLAAGADLAAGFLAMDAIRKSQQPISLIFKNMRAEFLKRAEGDVHFICDEGILVKDLVQKAIETGERVEMPVTVRATVPEKFGDETVATFTLTLSLKRKVKGEATSHEGNNVASIKTSATAKAAKSSKTSSAKNRA